jgi:NAD(P)-dependent dehydrogenase (short-subunit alcohol dehydrogenase family)
LGLAAALAFAAEGAAVVVGARSAAAVEAAVRQIRAAGGRASGRATDVADLAQVQALADLALSEFGRLDIWLNNAGSAGPYGPTLDFTPEAFRQVIDTNIVGVYHGSRVALRHFVAQRSGKLINLVGHGYNGPVPWQNAYGSSKAWVRSFTMALAAETKEAGVGVFAFNPGMVLTELLTNVEVLAGSEDRLKNFPAVVRMWAKPPERPAQKLVWLASAATDGQTGKLVNIFSPALMLGGALREWWRGLLKQPDPPTPVRLKVIPPAKS